MHRSIEGARVLVLRFHENNPLRFRVPLPGPRGGKRVGKDITGRKREEMRGERRRKGRRDLISLVVVLEINLPAKKQERKEKRMVAQKGRAKEFGMSLSTENLAQDRIVPKEKCFRRPSRRKRKNLENRSSGELREKKKKAAQAVCEVKQRTTVAITSFITTEDRARWKRSEREKARRNKEKAGKSAPKRGSGQ